jgi:hypothetical protein
MPAATRRVLNGLLSGTTLAVLVFGASQAFAAPPAESEQLACSFTVCRRYCEDTCPPWAGSCFGYCDFDTNPSGQCVCEYS